MEPIVLCIMDGCAIRTEAHGNAFLKANKPNFDNLVSRFPHSLLEASGLEVGLPKGQMGNSEVGHMNIGAGRIVYQPLVRIDKAIEDGTFFSNANLIEVMNHVSENNSSLHIMGLLSDGGIHSHINHLMAIIDLCKKEHIDKVYFHMFLDGRDTLPDAAIKYLDMLNDKIKEVGFGSIATLSGRYYAMDRDNNWDRVKMSYDAIVYGRGDNYKTYKEAIDNNYKNGNMDEFIIPAVLDKDGMVKENDGIILFNYRPDRIRELFKALTNSEFDSFPHENFKNVPLVTMMPLSDEVICKNAFSNQVMENTLGFYLADLGKKQLRIAETEKYAHVTYFFDGGVDKELPYCKRVLIPSPKVATYDLKPEMSAYLITDALLKELDSDDYSLVVLNFANGDMVGHTGNMEATIKAVEVVDECIGKIYEKVKELNGTLIVTADHGNSDYMLDDENHVITSHSIYNVPFIITNDKYELKNGKLADIAPTILTLMGEEIPNEMSGDVLVKLRSDRKVIFLERLFVTLSILLVLVFGVTYKLLDKKKDNSVDDKSNTLENENTLFHHLKEKKDSDGLYYSNGNYIYKGENVNNYLLYNGYMFRIISIDEEFNMNLILNDNITNLAFGSSNDYDDSYIKKWLNKTSDVYSGIFETSFSKNNQKSIKNIRLLSVNEYNASNDNGTYLKTDKSYFTMDKTDNNVAIITNEGNIDSSNPSSILGVRPVITLSSDIYFTGDGSFDNPYVIGESNSIHTFDYVSYSDLLWRVISVSDKGIELILDNELNVEDKNLFSFAPDYNKFAPTLDNTLAHYLNHDFYDTLDKTYILESTWYTGEYSSSNDYDYMSVYNDSVIAHVGLLKISDMNVFDTYLLTPTSNDHIYINKSNNISDVDVQYEYVVRPSIYISNKLSFSGDGTKNSPYIISNS